jgi:hypothetical protein
MESPAADRQLVATYAPLPNKYAESVFSYSFPASYDGAFFISKFHFV